MNDRPRPEHDRSAKQEFIARWKRARTAEQDHPDRLDVYPYPGLRSFQQDEADLFFGRDPQIKDLRELLADHNIIVVLGGSGSGKSSLVRGGQVPKLNSTSPIPGRAGAWYVVEFRPKLDPAGELFDALFNQLIWRMPLPSGDDDKPQSERAADIAKDRSRCIAALNEALDLDCKPDAPDSTVRQMCEKRLREILFEGDVVDVGALFDFVEDRLKVLDEALSDGASSGAPNLLLLIDQFEEVFKPKVDPAGRDMIMSLITSIHNYRPFNLFLIITMRSEELHRCAEFFGVTEVVNSSMYLVDLISGSNIEQAIVGPARRILKSWDLDPGDPDTGPYTPRALRLLHQVFDEGRETLPHKADQLPLMQHLLPLVWNKAVKRWESAPDDAPLSIDLEDIETLPGWSSPDGPLIGTLNARADRVLWLAIRAGAGKDGKVKPADVEQLLRVAFCCLAQLDDRGNVVRDFATLDQMLLASGVYERKPQQREELKQALQRALGVFQQATLVNLGKSYDVNHESLIRGWKKYANWLKDARRHRDRLVGVDRMLADDREPEQERGPLARLSKKATDYILVSNLARADRIAGDETSADLQDVLGPGRAFSTHWAEQVLERANAAKEDDRPVGVRIGAIKQTLSDATRYRAGAKYRTRNILLGLLGLIAVFGAWAWFEGLRGSAHAELTEQFRFFRLQGVVTAPPPDDGRPRYPTNDRELYAALQMVPEFRDKAKRRNVFLRVYTALEKAIKGTTGMDETTTVFRTSLGQLDSGARQRLSDVSIRILNAKQGETDLERAALNASTPASCAVADPATPQNLVGAATGRGVRLKPDERSGIPVAVMDPTVNAPNELVESSNFSGLSQPPGMLLCMSHDGNWLLLLEPQAGNQRVAPHLQRIAWIKVGDNKWHAQISPSRRATTWQSFDILQRSKDDLLQIIRSMPPGDDRIKSFNAGAQAGFAIPLKDGLAILWTNTGLLDPELVEEGPQRWEECGVKATIPGQGSEIKRIERCEKAFELDGLKYTLRMTNNVSRPTAPGFPSCDHKTALCSTELRLVPEQEKAGSSWFPIRLLSSALETVRNTLGLKGSSQDDGLERAVIQHLSSPVEAVSIEDDTLWVRDGNGQVWRYLVGFNAIKDLLPERWKGIEKNPLDQIFYSDACQKVKCDDHEAIRPLYWTWRKSESPQ